MRQPPTIDSTEPGGSANRFTDGKHQITIIYRKFWFLFPLASHPQAVHFVEKIPRIFPASHHCVHVKKPRQNYCYAYVFCLIEEKNIPKILPIHNYDLVLRAFDSH